MRLRVFQARCFFEAEATTAYGDARDDGKQCDHSQDGEACDSCGAPP